MKKSEFRQLIREEISKVLNEIGEGTAKPFEYKHIADTRDAIYYKFQTDPNPNKTYLGKPAPGENYDVELAFWDIENNTRSKTNLDIRFSTEGGEYEEETNDNMQYRVMATVLQIVKESLSKHPEITTLTFTPAKASKTDKRRQQFYQAYIQKQVTGSTIRSIKNGGIKFEIK